MKDLITAIEGLRDYVFGTGRDGQQQVGRMLLVGSLHENQHGKQYCDWALRVDGIVLASGMMSALADPEMVVRSMEEQIAQAVKAVKFVGDFLEKEAGENE